MASAIVTARGIVVTYDADAVNVPGTTEVDDAAVERLVAEAVGELGITTAQLDAVTCANSWFAQINDITRDEELVQVFEWQRGVDETNWRARIS